MAIPPEIGHAADTLGAGLPGRPPARAPYEHSDRMSAMTRPSLARDLLHTAWLLLLELVMLPAAAVAFVGYSLGAEDGGDPPSVLAVAIVATLMLAALIAVPLTALLTTYWRGYRVTPVLQGLFLLLVATLAVAGIAAG